MLKLTLKKSLHNFSIHESDVSSETCWHDGISYNPTATPQLYRKTGKVFGLTFWGMYIKGTISQRTLPNASIELFIENL